MASKTEEPLLAKDLIKTPEGSSPSVEMDRADGRSILQRWQGSVSQLISAEQRLEGAQNMVKSAQQEVNQAKQTEQQYHSAFIDWLRQNQNRR